MSSNAPSSWGERADLGSDLLPTAAVLRERDERLQALKDLVAHLAHDFNNSLVPLIGYLTLLSEDLNPAASGYEYLAKLDAAVRKAEGLIDLLVEATHPERRFSPKRLDLAELLQRTTEGWKKSLPATPPITVSWEFVPAMLFLDEVQWTKLIHHLLQNAQCAMAEGGAVRVCLRSQNLSSAQAADLGIHDTSVFELIVEDTGCGMSEETLRRACDPLFSTASDSNGAGLGLTLVHSVVQLHGGQFVIESALDVGTRVRIWLPSSGS